MTTAIEKSQIKEGEFYGILTWGGASSGLWLIAKVCSVGGKFVTYEVPNGSKVEKRRCKADEIYDAKECAKQSIANRPEYKTAYERYL